MSKRNLLLLVVICAFFVGFAVSPAQGQFHFELGGGLTAPVGDLNDFWGLGYDFSGSIFYQITPFSSFGVNLGYVFAGLAENDVTEADIFAPSEYISGGDLSIFNVCAELRFHTGAMEKALFFGSAGLGLFNLGLSDIATTYQGDTDITAFDRINKLGGFINGGVALPISQLIKIGLKCQYSFYAVDDDETFTDLGKTRSYFNINAVLIFNLE